MSLLIRIFAGVVIIAFASCISQKEEAALQLKQLLKEVSPEHKEIKNILILTENGCPNCNRSFALFLEKQMQNAETLCVVSAQGNKIDLSPFINKKNILLDFNGELKRKYSLMSNTSAILLDKNGIMDTIVKIEATHLEQSLSFLQKRIGS